MWLRQFAGGLGGVLRAAGRSIDGLGVAVQGRSAVVEQLTPNIANLAYSGVKPKFAAEVFVAPNACVIGNVEVGAKSSIWYGAVLRGDVNSVRIGEETNIQDRAIVHVARHNPKGDVLPTVIGNRVTIGHGALIHACTIEDGSLIGMGATVMDGCKVFAGAPAKWLRNLLPEEATFINQSATNYADLAAEHEMENTKTYEEVLYQEQLREDRAVRMPEHDNHLGLERDPVTRDIVNNPYTHGKVPF